MTIIHGFQLEISSRCNFKCSFCPVADQGGTFPQPQRTFAEEALIDEAIHYAATLEHLHYFTFSFIGEPMTHPHLFQHIRTARDNDLPLLLVTNGSLWKEEHISMIN